MPDSMDWVKNDLRSCDTCGRETDAGEWPDWINGSCEDCDPTILLGEVACDACDNFHEKDHMVVYQDILDHSSEKIIKFFCLPCMGES
jgi:hypothetical protein